MMRLLLVVTVVLGLTSSAISARILAVFPFAARSHFIFISSVLKTLMSRGHHVVEYSPFPPSEPIANYTHVEINTSLDDLLNKMTYEDLMKLSSDVTSFFSPLGLFLFTYGPCEDVFKNEKIQSLMKSDEKFDLVLVESPFGQDSMVVFGHKFSAPVISLQTDGPTCTLNMDTGNALSIAFVPEKISLPMIERMHFKERLMNLFAVTFKLIFYYMYQIPKHDELIGKYYRNDAPPLVDMISNVSLYLINAHPTVEAAQPYTPNVIPIAGIHISPERTALTQDLQKFMDEAKNGVIYFSLGSYVPVHLLPENMLQAFVNAFSKLKQKVLWKIDSETLPGLSENVKLAKWVPQPGILAHPNCVLFMTHGGSFSQQETIYAGVPTVGIPFFADQPSNVQFSEDQGFGVKLDLQTLSETSVLTAIRTVLKNPKYRENAQRLSRLFRDRPVSAADSVVFWVEYVLRHAGAHHLRPASTRLSWYQLALLDVLAVIVIPFVTILVVLYILLRKVFCSSKNKNKTISTNKKSN